MGKKAQDALHDWITNMSQESSIIPYSEWRDHGPLLIPCLAGIILCATHGFMMGVMIGPLEREFGWTRAEISSGQFITAVTALLLAPVAGAAVDRFGPRLIGLIGVPLYCGSLAMLSLATSNLMSWWALWLVIALASMLVMPMVWTTSINGYFHRHRGKALAVALSGTGIAAAIVPMLTFTLIREVGWRMAVVAEATIALLVAYPLVIFIFYGPGDRAITSASTTFAGMDPARTGVSVREAVRSFRFLKLAGGAVIFAVAAAALTFNAVPIVIAQGIEPEIAATIAGLVGLGSIIGRLVGGYLLDRFNAAKVAGMGVLIPLVVIVLLLAFENSVLMAALACLILGLAVGLEVDGCAYLAARHFGVKSFGTIFGTINGLLLFGSGIAPIVANAVFDVTGSYELFLWLSTPAFLTASALWLSLGPYPEFGQDIATSDARPGR